MNWSDLFTAIGLAAVIEGVLYAVFPDATKRAMLEFMSLPREARSLAGIFIAIGGLLAVWLARG